MTEFAADRNTPWAAVLTDMGTYSVGANSSHGKLSDGTCKTDPTNDPKVIQYCGNEGYVLNTLHSPIEHGLH